MADTEVTWNGITLGGDTGYIVQEITGWEDLPDISSYDEPRTRGHGDHVGDQFARSRIVTVTGKIADVSSRDDMARALQSVTLVSSVVSDLSVDLLGQSLTAGARIVRRSVGVGMNYSVGEIPFALQWKCPDPLRYGDLLSDSTGLPSTSGGLVFPVAFPADFGTPGDLGLLELGNTGTANAPILFAVTGPLPGGFELSGGGGRIAYPVEVPAGQVVTIDTGTGAVLVEGTSDRRASLTAAGSLTVQFTGLGLYDPEAAVTATWRPAFW